jgi:hypothetical protein
MSANSASSTGQFASVGRKISGPHGFMRYEQRLLASGRWGRSARRTARRRPDRYITDSLRHLRDSQGGISVHHQLLLKAEPEHLIGSFDPVRLERVVDNLVGNAVKDSPAGGAVTVTLRCQLTANGLWAVLSVSDEGVGIPAADLRHVFEPFRRASNVGRIISPWPCSSLSQCLKRRRSKWPRSTKGVIFPWVACAGQRRILLAGIDPDVQTVEAGYGRRKGRRPAASEVGADAVQLQLCIVKATRPAVCAPTTLNTVGSLKSNWSARDPVDVLRAFA